MDQNLAKKKIMSLRKGAAFSGRAPSARLMRPIDRNPNKPGLGWGGLNPKRANKDKTPVTSVANAPGRATIHPGFRPPTTPVATSPDRATIMPVPGSAGAPSLPSNEQRLKIAALAKSDKGFSSVNKSKAKNMAARAQRQAKLIDSLKSSKGKVNARQKSRFKKAAAFRAARMKALKSN